MAEPAKPRRPAVRSADEDDPVAAINDHLGRFLRNADALLDDWTRFGAEVRARVGGEVERIGGAVEEAVDGAVDRVAERTGDRVADEVAGRLVARLADVGAELDRVTRAARRASAAAADERHRSSRWLVAVLAAAAIADALLLVLLLRAPPSPPPPPRVPGLAVACDELARTWSDAAFAIVRDAGVSACGDLAPTVDAVILARFTAVTPPPAPEPEPAAGSGSGSGSGSGTGNGTTKGR